MDLGNDLRVLIAGDDPLVRAGLSALLSAEPGYEVVGEIGVDLHETTVPLSAAPDVLLCDLGRDVSAFGGRLSALESFGVPVLVLLLELAHGTAALASGAHGYLRRNTDGQRIAAALTAVAAGLQVIEPSDRGHDELIERAVTLPAEELTPREIEVLQLMAEGLANKAIARRLRISEHTVKFHVTAIMGKLDTHSRTETVTRAARLGLIIL